MTTNEIINKVNDYEDLVNQFKDKSLTGYIWMVEGKKPYIYDDEKIGFNKLSKDKKPQDKILEAYLKDEAHSIHIKNIDGKLRCFVFAYDDFKDNKRFDKKEIKYPSHKFTDKLLIFERVYELQNNPVSDGYKTWQPIVRLFKGFENTKNA